MTMSPRRVRTKRLIVYEFDVLGPYATKSAAVEAILADFESGRYGQYVTLIDDQMDMNDLLNSVGETKPSKF